MIAGRNVSPDTLARRVANLLGEGWEADTSAVAIGRLMRGDCTILIQPMQYELFLVCLDLPMEHRPSFTVPQWELAQTVAERVKAQLLPEYDRLADQVLQAHQDGVDWERATSAILLAAAPGARIEVNKHSRVVHGYWEDKESGRTAHAEVVEDDTAQVTFAVRLGDVPTLMTGWTRL